MTTRIGTSGSSTGISSAPSAVRVTAPPGQPFKAMLGTGANAILSGAEQAVTRLPGGPILAAALRPSASHVATASHAPASPVGVGAASPEGAVGTGALGGGAALAGGGGEPGGVEAALSQTANQNLYFLEIQERISAESRSYSAVSNVLKARHDTVKNAIGNIR